MKEDETLNSKYAEVFQKVVKSIRDLLVTKKSWQGQKSRYICSSEFNPRAQILFNENQGT